MPPSFQPPGPPATPPNPYDFIVNPQRPARSFSLPGANSTASRALYITGGLLVLLIIFVIIKGLFSGGNNLNSFVSVAQEQQAMIHIVTAAGQQQGTTAADQNFAATAQLSLISSRDSTIKYLASNGRKVNAKTIGLKESSAIDSQLANAATSGTYDQTFQQIMKNDLAAYMSDLKQTYSQNKGPKGRPLLNDAYNQAGLMLTQLNSAANQPQ